MRDDVEDEYFLGGDRDEGPDDERRTRRGALIGLTVVVLLVAIAITLTSVLVDTSSSASGPRTAALRWATALAGGDTATRQRLECADPSDTGDVLSRLLAGSRYRVSAGRATAQGNNRWAVPLQVDSQDGSSPVTSASVTVVRESGRYVVC